MVTTRSQAAASEETPLLSSSSSPHVRTQTQTGTLRQQVFQWTTSGHGYAYAAIMTLLILINVVAFVMGTVIEANADKEASSSSSHWRQFLAVIDLVTLSLFTFDALINLWLADLQDPKFAGFRGRLRYLTSFFGMVDVLSILPFYIHQNANTSWIRILRLLKLLQDQTSSYQSAAGLLRGVIQQQRGILGTAGFVGITTWMTISSLYYLVERRNHDLIYCPMCLDNDTTDLDTSRCTMDEWGQVDCSLAGCSSHCYNLYESIPMASYYALLNLFGEFPLINQHSVGGKLVGTFTAIVAVAVFALPVGIIGNGFEQVVAQQKEAIRGDSCGEEEDDEDANDVAILTPHFYVTSSTLSGRLYNFWHAQTSTVARIADHVIHALILCTVITFAVDTFLTPGSDNDRLHVTLELIEFVAVVAFTVEYLCRMYSITEDPKYRNDRFGRWRYMQQFLPVVDLLSFLPYWIQVIVTGGQIITPPGYDNLLESIVKSCRLLRILRFEKYTYAFRTFDNVFRRHADVLTLTAFAAFLVWIVFASILYFSERDNPDPEMASNYSSVPNSMWITLLNLAGESPLCQYSVVGKIATGFLGLFATGIFGIPIGVLGAGFEEIVEEKNEDNTEELEAAAEIPRDVLSEDLGTPIERAAYCFVNGIGSVVAKVFEASIYFLIFLVVAVGIWQTVEGHENDFQNMELVAVIIFTFEYLIRLVGAGADPEFAKGRNAFTCRVHFVFSFYSIVDLLAIIPFYLSLALPNSIVDEYDEYLRMLRILRLIKLDKYVPSITLLDDVVRLKFNSLRVAFYAAVTLWIMFAALLFLCEHRDTTNEIDPVPSYGCDDNCTMMDRFQNFLDSMVYTGIHLTGDYPIITYTWPARIVNFFMVIAAVGVVSIPSGLIASGFVEIVQSKNKALRGESLVGEGQAGDDWYEHRYRELQGVDPPRSPWGPRMDRWQTAVNEYLNGKTTEGGHTEWTTFSYSSRVFIFTVIIANVLAVILESIPRIDKAVGNQPGNFFDVFEMFSVMVFALEYILRLFCAPKNRQALYSPWVYATTFFGIVDFLSTAPWFVQEALIASGHLDATGDNAKIFRIFRIFRILQLEDFVVAFSKLDNVFRASKDVLKATGLMAIIIWVGCGALFFIFEENNPNWRSCDPSIPARSSNPKQPGCYDFSSTSACNDFYPGQCTQTAFTSMPDALYYTAVFLGGEWGVVDFTWPGRIVCLFLCIAGIALYAIPIGTLFDSFGAVLGLVEDD